MAHHTLVYQYYTLIPVTYVPTAQNFIPPVLALAQPVTHLQGLAQPQYSLTTTAIAQQTLAAAQRPQGRNSETRAREEIVLGIEVIKQQKLEEGLAHFQAGFNFTPDSRFYTWMMTKWHSIVLGKVEENILEHVDIRLNINPNDSHAKFVKALCCVKPELYFLAISLLKEFLEENPGHQLTIGLLKSVVQMNKRLNKGTQPALNPEQIHHAMSFRRLLN